MIHETDEIAFQWASFMYISAPNRTYRTSFIGAVGVSICFLCDFVGDKFMVIPVLYYGLEAFVMEDAFTVCNTFQNRGDASCVTVIVYTNEWNEILKWLVHKLNPSIRVFKVRKLYTSD